MQSIVHRYAKCRYFVCFFVPNVAIKTIKMDVIMTRVTIKPIKQNVIKQNDVLMSVMAPGLTLGTWCSKAFLTGAAQLAQTL
jgi:hypothetical protein